MLTERKNVALKVIYINFVKKVAKLLTMTLTKTFLSKYEVTV